MSSLTWQGCKGARLGSHARGPTRGLLGELALPLLAPCSHSLHRLAEVVVSDGALPAGGRVQSAPGSVRMELQRRTQSQNHQGIPGRPLYPSLLFPLPTECGGTGLRRGWEGVVSRRSVSSGEICELCGHMPGQSLWTVSTLGTGVRALGFEV